VELLLPACGRFFSRMLFQSFEDLLSSFLLGRGRVHEIVAPFGRARLLNPFSLTLVPPFVALFPLIYKRIFSYALSLLE